MIELDKIKNDNNSIKWPKLIESFKRIKLIIK